MMHVEGDKRWIKLEDLKSKSANAWMDLKSGMDAAMENLKKSYNEALSHFK